VHQAIQIIPFIAASLSLLNHSDLLYGGTMAASGERNGRVTFYLARKRVTRACADRAHSARDLGLSRDCRGRMHVKKAYLRRCSRTPAMVGTYRC
jgi:hypothetical protein